MLKSHPIPLESEPTASPPAAVNWPVLVWVVLAPLLLVLLAGVQYWRMGSAGDQSLWGAAFQWSCMLVLGAGVLAAVIGAWGMARMALAGRAARGSREVLIAQFARWHRLLPRYLNLILGLTAAGLLLLALQECLLTWARFHEEGSKVSGVELKVRLSALVLLLGLAWAAMTAFWRLRNALSQFKAEPMPLLGRPVSPQRAPGLWREVLQLAQQIGAKPPDHIVVGMAQGFFVTAGALRLLPGNQQLQGQTLYMPLTYLSLLPAPQVRAAMAHELAHFAGADTLYSQRFAPLYHGFAQRLDVLATPDEKGGVALSLLPALHFAGYLLEQFHLAVAHWSRQRELAADAVAARMTTPQALADALLDVTLTSAQIDAALRQLAELPDGPIVPLASALHSARAEADAALAAHDWAQASTNHPTDSHPPTAERIRAVGLAFDDALLTAAQQRAAAAEPQPLDAWFADPVKIEYAVAQDFRQHARQARAQFQAALSQMAERGSGELAVFERTTLAMAAFAVAALAIGLVPILLTWPEAWPRAALLGAALGAPFGWLVWSYWQRGRARALLLTPEAVHITGLAAPLPYADVLHFEVEHVSGAQVLTFHLMPETPLPQRVRPHYRRVKIKRKQRQLVLTLGALRGMTPAQLSEAVNDYFQAQMARQVLAGM